MAVLRVTANVEVRKVNPVRSGTTRDIDWSFQTVEVLDSDYNKAEVTLADDLAPPTAGGRYVCELDVETDRRAKGRAVLVSYKESK